MQNIKKATNLIELIYALEPLCYYFSMMPQEFWNSTYRQINLFTQSNLAKNMDDLRREINVQEAVTDKLIMADAMSTARPKIKPIRDAFPDVFPEKEKQGQTSEDITRIMRNLMKNK